MLDAKTRWNSFLAMLEQIVEIKALTSKALIDCNQELGTFDLEKQETDVIHHLVSSLEPVKSGAEKLDDRSSTLLSAEGFFRSF